MSEEYPNDKETQEWMNAPLGQPSLNLEEQVKFWSDKYDAKVDELHEMWKEARSFEGSFNAATEAIKRLKEEVSFLKESRSKWAKQSSENADELEKVLATKNRKIGYKCPSCENSTVMIDCSGFLVCTFIGCKDPSRIHEIISRELIWEKGEHDEN